MRSLIVRQLANQRGFIGANVAVYRLTKVIRPHGLRRQPSVEIGQMSGNCCRLFGRQPTLSHHAVQRLVRRKAAHLNHPIYCTPVAV